MRKVSLLLISVTALLSSACGAELPTVKDEAITGIIPGDRAAWSATPEVAFGPQTFTRESDSPEAEITTVAISNLSQYEQPMTIHVQNGNQDGSMRVGDLDRVSSATISLGGSVLFGPSDFSPQVANLSKEIILAGEAELTIELRSKPGAFVKIRIEGIPKPAEPPPGGTTFDPVADYDAGWLSGNNPNGVWSYGWSSTLGSPVTLYTQNYTTTQDCPGSTYRAWNDPSNNLGFTPAVIKNSGPTCSNGNVDIPANALVQHFGGTGSGTNYTHVIFTAPFDGSYTVSITFTGRQVNVDSDANVLVKGALVQTAFILANGQTFHYSGTHELLTGETISFATGPGTLNFLHSGHVGLSGTIVGVPE